MYWLGFASRDHDEPGSEAEPSRPLQGSARFVAAWWWVVETCANSCSFTLRLALLP